MGVQIFLCDLMVCPWNSPGKNTGVRGHSLFQGIFLTQGLNPHLLHCRQILYLLSHWGSLNCFYLRVTNSYKALGHL